MASGAEAADAVRRRDEMSETDPITDLLAAIDSDLPADEYPVVHQHATAVQCDPEDRDVARELVNAIRRVIGLIEPTQHPNLERAVRAVERAFGMRR